MEKLVLTYRADVGEYFLDEMVVPVYAESKDKLVEYLKNKYYLYTQRNIYELIELRKHNVNVKDLREFQVFTIEEWFNLYD